MYFSPSFFPASCAAFGLRTAALAVILSLAACGGDNDNSSSNSGDPQTSQPGVGNNGSLVIPAAPVDPDFVDSAPVNTSVKAYVDTYNTSAKGACYSTVETNASVRLVSKFLDLWSPLKAADGIVHVDGNSGFTAEGDCPAVAATTWNGAAETGGTKLNSAVLDANINYVKTATTANFINGVNVNKAAWADDVNPKNWSMAEGAGRLTSAWRTGLGASNTDDYATNTQNSDSEGSDSSDLGLIVTLAGSSGVGNAASGDMTKWYYKYQRPYRWLGDRSIVEANLWQKNQPEGKAGKEPNDTTVALQQEADFVSGHTAEFVRRAAAFAYALPERFQEFYARALEGGENRILAGVHTPLAVIGGRMYGLAAVAANLYNEENADATAKNANVTAASLAATREQALSAMQTASGKSDWKEFYTWLHSGQNTDSTAADYDKYADHDAARKNFERRMNIGMADHAVGATDADPVVPKGAEVLIKTRYPYLSADQRRVVLKTTEFASGYPVMNDDEGWGRLDMFKAGDGYGAFNGLVTINMDSSVGTFGIYDVWRNDISGSGKLKLQGDGTLKLAGNNTWSGGTEILAGTLIAASANALGKGTVYLNGDGILEIASGTALQAATDYVQTGKSVLTITTNAGNAAALQVKGNATLDTGSTLRVSFDTTPTAGQTIAIIQAGKLQGSFGTIVLPQGMVATAIYEVGGMSLRVQ